MSVSSKSFCTKGDPDKCAHRLTVVETILSVWVRDIEPLLQDVDPKHSLNANGRASSLTGGIIGLDQSPTFPSRDDGLHLAQKALTPRLLMVSMKTNAGKGYLTHDNLADSLNQIQSILPRSGDLIRES